MSKEKGHSSEQPLNYFAFFSAAFSALGAATFVAGFAALVFPKDPAKILPFFVLISPRPMLYVVLIFKIIKKARYRWILLSKCFCNT
jgi:hypothetical protein